MQVGLFSRASSARYATCWSASSLREITYLLLVPRDRAHTSSVSHKLIRAFICALTTVTCVSGVTVYDASDVTCRRAGAGDLGRACFGVGCGCTEGRLPKSVQGQLDQRWPAVAARDSASRIVIINRCIVP